MIIKYDFLKVVKIPYPKNRFLVTLRPFFSTYIFFSGRGWFFPVIILKLKYFNEKLSSLAGLKKSCSLFRKRTDFDHFDYLGPLSKSIFSTYRQIYKKISVSFLRKVVRNIVVIFGLSISAGLWGG